jgi:hypothetical protein
VITAAELLTEIGDCRERYRTRDAFAADAGQAAVANESGKWKTAGFRRACNKRLRIAFCRLADSSRHWHPWAQDLYAQARQRGHEHPRAIRTLGRTWCRVVWQCWRNHTPYDPARHRALQRHITVTIPTPSGGGLGKSVAHFVLCVLQGFFVRPYVLADLGDQRARHPSQMVAS